LYKIIESKKHTMGAILKYISKSNDSKIPNSKLNLSKKNFEKLNSLLEKDKFAWVGTSKEEYKENSIPSHRKYSF